MGRDTLRLDRLLSERGLGSRRVVGTAIRHGRVFVDGVRVRDPRHPVRLDTVVVVDGQVSRPLPVLIVWHKPVGVLTTLDDPWGREGVESVLPAGWSEVYHPVGRLDRDTSGLLLFSRDGAITQRLLHPKHAVPRTYIARVEVTPPDLASRLVGGVSTAAGVFQAEDVQVEAGRVRLTVREGKHRMVRRMLHNAGASVVDLHREAYGHVALGALREGRWRAVTREELEALVP